MTTILVVMAAGIGSRYGAGIKQLAKMDENGYTIIDYSIYDAKKAGFDKVIFIIRPDIEKDFKEIIGSRIEQIIDVEYAYQILDLDKDYPTAKNRKKPWGTVHAVLAAKDLVNEPFLVINADDYYGKNVFKNFYDFLNNDKNKDMDKLQIAMAGYKLKNTLSDNGSVTRGVSVADNSDKLVKIIETHEIEKRDDGTIASRENLGADLLNLETIVSMNMWASFPKFIDYCQEYFDKFLEENKDDLSKAEYVLPEMIEQILEKELIEVSVLKTNDKWIGITYKEDLRPAQEEFKKMLEAKDYPANIWA